MTDRAPTSGSGEGEPDEDAREERPDAERSVLSNLPRTRPGVRSRHRDPRQEAETQPGGKRRAPAARKASEPAPESEPSGATGLEDIALGGVRAAAGAAGAGIRVGRWAAGALRDAVRRD